MFRFGFILIGNNKINPALALQTKKSSPELFFATKKVFVFVSRSFVSILALTPTHTLIHSHPLTVTHAHTHSPTHTHTRSHTLTLSLRTRQRFITIVLLNFFVNHYFAEFLIGQCHPRVKPNLSENNVRAWPSDIRKQT